MTVSSPDIVTGNKNEQYFFKFISTILNIELLTYIFHCKARQNKCRPAGDTFFVSTQEKNLFSSRLGAKTIFRRTASSLVK